jgi:hypothetical protein
VEEAPTMNRDAGIGLLRRTAFPPGRRAGTRCRRPRMRAAPSPTSTMRTPSSSKLIRIRSGRAMARAILQVTPDHHPNRALVGVVGARPAARCSSVCRSALGQPQAR